MPSAKIAKTRPASTPRASQKVQPVTAPLAWPALPTPEQRSYPLELEELVARQIVLIHGFFPAKACSAWTDFLSESKSIMLEASPAAKKGEAQRTNHRFSIQDKAFAEALWQDTGLADLITSDNSGMFKSSETANGVPSGLNPNVRIYRYEPGQSFAPHYDDTVKVGNEHTEWTLLIYLSGSDEVLGGETAFYPCGLAPTENGKERKRKIRPGDEDVVVELKKGLALLHRHGRECLLHEGKPVLKGVKWVLRSDIILSKV